MDELNKVFILYFRNVYMAGVKSLYGTEKNKSI